MSEPRRRRSRASDAARDGRKGRNRSVRIGVPSAPAGSARPERTSGTIQRERAPALGSAAGARGARPVAADLPVGAEVAIEGVVDRVRWESDDGDFQVIVVRAADGTQRAVVARGAALAPGESVRVAGTVREHRSGERQIDAGRIERVLPVSREGIVEFLGSGKFRGIGPKTAEQIVDHFGPSVLETLDRNPDRIVEVPGIGPKRGAELARLWAEQAAVRSIMVFLHSHGISTAWANRIFRAYGARAVPVVQRDPYRLARDVRGIGFRMADKIARAGGIAIDDPRRIEAGTEYALGNAADEGHLFVPREELVTRAATIVECSERDVDSSIDRLIAAARLAEESVGDARNAIYLASARDEERELAERLLEIATVPSRVPEVHAGDVSELERRSGLSFSRGQRDAMRTLCSASLGVLTGGPGTGKTTLVRAILRHVAQTSLRAELCAPTGRAARRLSESTGASARTLHRLLEFDPRQGLFLRNAENRLDTDLVIVDEASMLDQALATALVRAIEPGTALLLVGDIEQLPSVGPGDVLRDVIQSRRAAVVTLDRVFRQESQSGILDAAHAIRGGLVPEPASRAPGEYFMVKAEDPSSALRAVVRVVTERIPSAFGLDPRRDVQVLVPMHRGPLGTEALNEALQAALNPETGARGSAGGAPRSPDSPSSPPAPRARAQFRVGDKVMQTRNNYSLETFNGDIGFVVHHDPESRAISVQHEGRTVTYDSASQEDLDLAWAVSVHKSQGSEFPAVVLVLTTQHFKLLQRNLVYTAITRARRLVVVVGMKRALAMAIANTEAGRRYTGLRHRLEAVSRSGRA